MLDSYSVVLLKFVKLLIKSALDFPGVWRISDNDHSSRGRLGTVHLHG